MICNNCINLQKIKEKITKKVFYYCSGDGTVQKKTILFYEPEIIYKNEKECVFFKKRTLSINT